MGFLNNTEIVVGIGFVIFIGMLVYYRVPRLIARSSTSGRSGSRPSSTRRGRCATRRRRCSPATSGGRRR